MNTPVYAEINLSTGKAKRRAIPPSMFKKYIGGKTLAAKLLYELTPPGIDPLAPEAMIIVNTGPMNGTGAPSSSRFNISFKNVMTGGIASSNCGGTFGIMMKRAGFDGLIITGRAEKPCHIELVDGKISVRSAEKYWGMDTQEAQDALPKHLGKLLIGPAGENLVRYAGVVSGERIAGRCGGGAVLGSKNVKIITAYGTQKTFVHSPKKFTKYVKKWTDFIKNHPMTGEALPRYGSAGLVNKANATHALPTRNFQTGHHKDADKVSGETLTETLLVRNSSCVSCPIRCERRVKMGGKEVKGPEYETLGFFGPNIDASDLEAVIRLNYVCDLLGMDTISAASSIAFAMELGERGVADFGVQFGKVDNLEEVLTKTAHREGIYSDLANGSKWMSKKYGGEEYAMHSKGLELASYEPRRSVGMGLGYAVSNRGGCHLNGGYMALLESVGVLSTDAQKPNSKAEFTVFMQDALEAVSAAGFCFFSAQTFIPGILFELGPNHFITRFAGKALTHSGPVIRLLLAAAPILRLNSLYLLPHAKALGLATGLPMDTGKFILIGERSYNIERLYNLREGLTSSDDELPERLTKTPQVPGDDSTVVPLDDMLPRYYATRGWDKHGVPKARQLKKLGMM